MTIFCADFLLSRPLLFVIFTLSCFNYSLIGIYTIYQSNNLNLIYEPFEQFNGHCILGCVLFYQGIFSYLHDVYGTYLCDVNYYRNLDIIFAIFNFVYASFILFYINWVMDILFIISCCILYIYSVYLSSKKSNTYIYVHILWHTVPLVIAFIGIHISLSNLVNSPYTLQQQASSDALSV